jgi:S-adenosylmethionine decarboxylase
MEGLTQERLAEDTPRVIGRHVYGNLKGCRNYDALTNPAVIERVLREAGRVGRMTILDVKSWKIGEGVSAVAIVLESHITIHTWPEYRFATVDVYACGSQSNPLKAFNYIAKVLEPEDVVMGSADRSLE